MEILPPIALAAVFLAVAIPAYTRFVAVAQAHDIQLGVWGHVGAIAFAILFPLLLALLVVAICWVCILFITAVHWLIRRLRGARDSR
jgi:hypothetical protein